MEHENSNSFTVPSTVEIRTGMGRLPQLRVHNDHGECEIYLYGAHISRFVPKGKTDLLWMSPSSPYEEGKALRGGIPICFPWFGPHRSREDFPMHGFVRTRVWEVRYVAQLSDHRTRIGLGIESDESTLQLWPYPFVLDFEITVGSSLELCLTVENPGIHPFLYEDCLHTYFNVTKPQACEIHGLEGTAYIDRTKHDARAVQVGPLRVDDETVKAYMRTPQHCELRDSIGNRNIIIDQNGFSSIVVWNPGATAGSKNPELGAAWDQFICVESANCLDSPIVLSGGNAHRSRVLIHA